nr:copia protein [Tanacetum cinerariifolium]GEV71034.1 copia protein [Tanacetum cinerariifolium]
MSRKRVLTLDKDNESIDSTKYKGMIGSLLYLTASRPDIMFSVYLYASFQEDPKVYHLESVKRIFRYIKGTQHLGLWYPKNTGVNVLVYANSDHAGDVVDRKSTSGIWTFVGSCLTLSFLKKQTSRTNSITESDYVAFERACQQALWMKQAFVYYNITLNEVSILCDDKCTINLTSSLIDHPRTKHIEIRHHFLKDNVAKKHITIEKIPLGENVANILTKPLEKDQFSYLRLGLGLMFQEEEEEE